MWLKSHKWVHTPYYGREIRRELRVRESRQTVTLFDRKYYDVETGKYITDKLPKLYHSSIADIIDDTIHNTISYGNYTKPYREERESNVYNFPKFIPRDNDFEEQCRKEELKKQKDEESRRIQEEINQINLSIAEKERKYIEYVQQRERIIKEEEEARIKQRHILLSQTYTENPLSMGEQMLIEARKIREKYQNK